MHELKMTEIAEPEQLVLIKKEHYADLCQSCEFHSPESCGEGKHQGFIKPNGTCFWYRIPL